MKIEKCGKIVAFLALGAGLLITTEALATVISNPSNSSSKSSEYAPGELIVKLSEQEGSKVQQALAGGKKLNAIQLSSSLTELNTRHKTNSIERVFKFPLRKGRFATSSEVAENAKKRYPLRSKRAPKGAVLPDLTHIYKLTFPKDADVLELAGEYAGDPAVEYAQPNYIYDACGIPPNDPYYSSSGSWGQSYDDLWGLKKIESANAWSSFASPADIGNGVTVAVVDSGAGDGELNTDVAPGQSLSRIDPRVDTNNAADFQAGGPSPGS